LTENLEIYHKVFLSFDLTPCDILVRFTTIFQYTVLLFLTCLYTFCVPHSITERNYLNHFRPDSTALNAQVEI